MNGKTITSTDTKTNANYEMFYIFGELIVTGNGKIEISSTTDRDWNNMSTIFHNRGGKLKIENGTFINSGGTDMAYVIDNSTNSYGDAETTINDGYFKSSYITIRNRLDKNVNGPYKGIVNINGGTLESTSVTVWNQISSSGNCYGEVNITDGTFIAPSGKANILSGTPGENDVIIVNITGGNFTNRGIY